MTLSWNKDTKSILFNLHCGIDGLFKDKELLNEIRLEITDDDTPSYAGGVISLGYYVLRIIMKNARVTLDKDQMMFQTKFIEGFSFRLSRPARRPISFPDFQKGTTYHVKPFVFSPNDDSNITTIIIGEDHSKDWKFVRSYVCRDKFIVGKLSPMSLFSPIEEVERGMRPNVKPEERHNQLISEVIE